MSIPPGSNKVALSRQNLRIRLKALSKGFANGSLVFDRLDLNLSGPGIIAFLGMSGCGKTTLLRLIGGLESPDSGVLEIEPELEQPLGMGYVFQEPRLLPWMKVRDNLALPLKIAGMDSQKVREATDELLELTGLMTRAGDYPGQLSGGMKMRVSVARALVGDPPLILMDEPFAALDIETRENLNAEVVRLQRIRQATILFVTHSLREAVFLADTIYLFPQAPVGKLECIDNRLDAPRDQHWRSGNDYRERVLTLGDRIRGVT